MSDIYDGPLYATIKDTCDRFGPKPSKLYEILGEGHIKAKKFGKRVLVDQRSAKEYFDSLPIAKIKPSARARRRLEEKQSQSV